MAMSVLERPGTVVDAEPYLRDPTSPEGRRAAEQVAYAFEFHGFLVIRGLEVDFELGLKFMKNIERFALLPESERLKCWRPDRYHQAGLTPRNKEKPGSLKKETRDKGLDLIPPEHAPHPVTGPDLKERFMINIGRRPTEPTGLKYPDLDNPLQVVPDGFPDWLEVAVPWGEQLRDAGIIALEMAAVGWGCANLRLLADPLVNGYNLLAPTFSDLTEDGVGPDTVFAGVHKDSSQISVHCQATTSGLDVWPRDLQKCEAVVPLHCLLMQPGRILETLTGGRALRGFHQVVNRPRHMAMIEQARREGRRIIRVASPMFGRPATDFLVKPLGEFATPEALANPDYAPEESGARLIAGLRRRNLAYD